MSRKVVERLDVPNPDRYARSFLLSPTGKRTENMSFKSTIDSAKEQGTVNTGGQQEELEQIEVEMGDISFVHFQPTTAVTGTFPADEGNPIIRFPDAQHNEGRLDQGYLGLVLDDVGVSTDADEGTENTVILDVEDSNEIRIFNADDVQTDVLDGIGVEYNDRLYKGEVVDAFPEDRAIIVVSGSASKSVARTLDVNGAPLAGMDETGQKNNGLIEYPNGAEAEVYSRYARNPELREALHGSEVGIMVVRREEFDEEYAELVESGERRAMKYFLVQGDLGDGTEMLEPVEGEPVGYSWLDWNWEEGGASLPASDEEFIEGYRSSGMPTDRDTIISNIEENAGSLSGDTAEDTIVRMIQQ